MTKSKQDMILDLLHDQDKKIRELEKEFHSVKKALHIIIKIVEFIGAVVGATFYIFKFLGYGVKGRGKARGQKKQTVKN